MSVQSRLAILDVISRYAHAWDDRDPDTYADTFTIDAIFESYISQPEEVPVVRHEGRVAILAWARDRAADLTSKCTRHSPGVTVFDRLTPTVARTRTLLLESVLQPGDETPWLTNTGVYLDDWRNTSDGWKLSHRIITHDRSQRARPFDSPRPE